MQYIWCTKVYKKEIIDFFFLSFISKSRLSKYFLKMVGLYFLNTTSVFAFETSYFATFRDCDDTSKATVSVIFFFRKFSFICTQKSVRCVSGWTEKGVVLGMKIVKGCTTTTHPSSFRVYFENVLINKTRDTRNYPAICFALVDCTRIRKNKTRVLKIHEFQQVQFENITGGAVFSYCVAW